MEQNNITGAITGAVTGVFHSAYANTVALLGYGGDRSLPEDVKAAAETGNIDVVVDEMQRRISLYVSSPANSESFPACRVSWASRRPRSPAAEAA
ncbi:hypothetical protein ACIQWN_38215 [Streptomyces vinaceus]|uniref:hypothetical protein n=1 Tax=Streptomyces vinaceus TaxID=1960 RepID=UPI0037F86F8A